MLRVELVLSGDAFDVKVGLEDLRTRVGCDEEDTQEGEEDFGDAGDFDVTGRDDNSGALAEEVGDASSVTVAGRAVTGPSWATGDVGEAGAGGSEGDMADCPGCGSSPMLLLLEFWVSTAKDWPERESATLVDLLRESLMALIRDRDSLMLVVRGSW